MGTGQQGSGSLVSHIWGGDTYIHCAVTTDCEHLPLVHEMMKNDGFEDVGGFGEVVRKWYSGCPTHSGTQNVKKIELKIPT